MTKKNKKLKILPPHPEVFSFLPFEKGVDVIDKDQELISISVIM